MEEPTVDETHTFERTFTTDDVERFAALSGDRQDQHTEPDSDGRLLVHGLLTATLPTKIGGDLEVLATEMTFQFRRPVYTGEQITCLWTFDTVDEQGDRYAVTVDVECTNSDAESVLTGDIEGLIWKAS
ncbi:hotdog family protein [Natronorubrum sulfidifaciens]|uniref:MaoC domain-containing protein dehydratase n=1 Tax=Natronorubrum sulfidifaciens JCM 14089 TaxID=1230460 RepID=L9W9C3_9EURY|nr:MaoC/PaaZ C-terminal domain-containing protein [Natronorubrum sulfidifaciens]ELY46070.1 MaoC domain-containing protein dehydratase [Natronorubrum sulfidifaciens JCM 14089]